MSDRTALEKLRLSLVCNTLVLSLFLLVGTIALMDRTAYYLVVQEDGSLEWATVFVMLPAAYWCANAMLKSRDAGRLDAWFWAGLCAFCIFFAGEEISWGQRLMSYQPPEYFLEHNSQQELNVHNLFKQFVRTRYLLLGILVLYGILLPVLRVYVEQVRDLADRLGIVVLPASMVPSFVVTAAFLAAYPLKYSGEVAECLFALGLFLAIAVRADEDDRSFETGLPLDARLTAIVAVCGLLAVLTPAIIEAMPGRSDEARAAVAAEEVEALGRDWAVQADKLDGSPSRCGSHIRLFTWVRKHDHDVFRRGEYAALDMDEARRTYFLDPWNNPYWIRHECEDRDIDGIYLYSFGPDAQRSSTDRALGGDDVGVDIGPAIEAE